MDFLSSILKDTKNEFASRASDGIAAGDVETFVDTGSYIFNALVSGSIFGGIPSNKITALAGESGTGKTFFCLSVVRSFLDANPDAGVIYFETESAISRQMIESRGIDSKRLIIMPVNTIEEFRTQAVRIVDKYMETPKSERVPMMFVLDSLGMLATNKEVEDASNDKNVRDMTKAQLIKSCFRILTLKLEWLIYLCWLPITPMMSSALTFLQRKWEEEVVSNIPPLQSFISERKRRKMERYSLETLSNAS